MPTLRVKTAALLVKIESSEGVDAAPSAATDGVLIENLRVTLTPNITDTNEVTPSLDPFAPIVGGMSVALEFDMYLKGSGTPGTAPEFGDLLKVCGWSETITAAAIPAAPEALAAGGSTTTAVLGASAASTAQAYRGMPISFSGAVAGDSFIWDYSAAKTARLTDTLAGALVATSNYQIPVNVLYAPASLSIPSATVYWYNDGILYTFLGCRGNSSLTLTSGGPARLSFRLMGAFGAKSDAALPTVPYDSTRPPIWKAGAFTVNAAAAAARTLTLDMGSQVVQPDNPNAGEGYDPAIITARQPRGSIDPKETLVGTRDVMADFRGQIVRPIHGRLTGAAGNRLGITIPAALYLNQTPEDRDGYRVVTVPFHATGQDAGMFLCFY